VVIDAVRVFVEWKISFFAALTELEWDISVNLPPKDVDSDMGLEKVRVARPKDPSLGTGIVGTVDEDRIWTFKKNGNAPESIKNRRKSTNDMFESGSEEEDGDINGNIDEHGAKGGRSDGGADATTESEGESGDVQDDNNLGRDDYALPNETRTSVDSTADMFQSEESESEKENEDFSDKKDKEDFSGGKTEDGSTEKLLSDGKSGDVHDDNNLGRDDYALPKETRTRVDSTADMFQSEESESEKENEDFSDKKDKEDFSGGKTEEGSTEKLLSDGKSGDVQDDNNLGRDDYALPKETRTRVDSTADMFQSEESESEKENEEFPDKKDKEDLNGRKKSPTIPKKKKPRPGPNCKGMHCGPPPCSSRCPRWNGDSKVLLNNNLVSESMLEELCKEQGHNLTPEQKQAFLKSVNPYVETMFNELSDETRLCYGVWSFQAFKKKCKDKGFFGGKSVSNKWLTNEIKKGFKDEKSRKNAEGKVYPAPNSSNPPDTRTGFAAFK
jgi:hypothetical protein